MLTEEAGMQALSVIEDPELKKRIVQVDQEKVTNDLLKDQNVYEIQF